MARPKQCRFVQESPAVTYFRPRGPLPASLEEEHLSVEELEALRLADVEGLSNSMAAERMRVSRHTFGRVLANARKSVARAVCLGRALRVGGGSYVSLAELTPLESVRKLAVASSGKELSSPFEETFGRARGFVVVDLATNEHSHADNALNANRPRGAGRATVEWLKHLGVEAVCAARFGDKSRFMLHKEGMRAFECEADTVETAVAAFRRAQNEAREETRDDAREDADNGASCPTAS